MADRLSFLLCMSALFLWRPWRYVSVAFWGALSDDYTQKVLSVFPLMKTDGWGRGAADCERKRKDAIFQLGMEM